MPSPMWSAMAVKNCSECCSRSCAVFCSVMSWALTTIPPMAGSSKQLVEDASRKRQLPEAVWNRKTGDRLLPCRLALSKKIFEVAARSSGWTSSNRERALCVPGTKPRMHCAAGFAYITLAWSSRTAIKSLEWATKVLNHRSREAGSAANGASAGPSLMCRPPLIARTTMDSPLADCRVYLHIHKGIVCVEEEGSLYFLYNLLRWPKWR